MGEVERDRRQWLEVAITAGFAAAPAVAVGGVEVGVGGALSVAVAHLYDLRRQRVAELGADLLADHPAAEVLERLEADERFGELFVRAAEVTAVSAWEPKRRAMGAVVRAVMAGDDAALDDGELLLVALERMDAPHFAGLQRLDAATAALPEAEGGVDPATIGLAQPVLAPLVAVGAATLVRGWDVDWPRSSDFGRRLLALVLV